MTTEQKVEKVKDLLNELVVLTSDEGNNEFLVEVNVAAKSLLVEKQEDPEDYYASEDYYDSNC